MVYYSLCGYVDVYHTLMQGGRTALAWAAFEGHKEVVDILLSAGAKGDVQDQVVS